MSEYALRRGQILLAALALATSGCQTIEQAAIDEGVVVNAWRRAPLTQSDNRNNRVAAASGASRLTNARNDGTIYSNGTGRFVGEPSSPSRQATPDRSEDGVTLNLVNVPAPQAAKTVLGDILGIQYTIDPSIEGKITIQTPKPVARATVTDLFQSALRSNGAALVNANGLYRIVPADQATTGANIQVGSEPEAGLGSNLQVVQLRYVAASEMRRVLEPISPRGGIVRTDDARNIITLSGNRQELASLLEAISIFDVDVMQGMSFALVPVKASQPDTIADELKTIFATDREGPMAGMVRFLPNRRLGAILVISAQPGYLARAEAWVRKLDAQAQGSEKQFFTYSVQNRRAQELVDVLQSMFSNETGAARNGTSTRKVAPQYQEASLRSRAQQSSGMFNQGAGASRSTQPPGEAGSLDRPEDRSTGSAAQLGGNEFGEGPRIKVVADEAKNAILIEAAPADYQRLLRVVRTLDVVPKQVLIEATIAEITLNDALKFGLRWHVQSKSADFTFSDALNGAVSSVFPGFSYALTAANIGATLNALNDVTHINVLSSPSLMVMDNRPALLQIGDQVPIVTQSAISTVGNLAPIVNSVSYRDTGVILSITPRINESGLVLLDIEQEVSSVASTTTSGIDSPTIRQRRIKTNVVVNDGDALVLGGLIQDGKTISSSQVPILGDIPVIGSAFRDRTNDIGKTELIIIITPRVVRNLSEARQVTEEFRQALTVHGPQQRRRQRQIDTKMRRIFE